MVSYLNSSHGGGHHVGLLTGSHQLGEAELPLRDVELEIKSNCFIVTRKFYVAVNLLSGLKCFSAKSEINEKIMNTNNNQEIHPLRTDCRGERERTKTWAYISFTELHKCHEL